MNLEILERRRLLSVSVVQGYPGYYEVYGDESPDVISISVSNETSSFTLNGTEYGGVSYVSIFADAGDDSIAVSISGSGPIGASIDAGAGNDTATLAGGGAIWGDSGDDVIRISDAFRGEAYGGPGNDSIVVRGACADAEILGGPGNDHVDLSGSAYGLFAHGGPGDDTILGSGGDDQLYGDPGSDMVYGAGGNDVLYASDGERDRVIGGAGIDIGIVDAGEAGVWGVEYVFYV